MVKIEIEIEIEKTSRNLIAEHNPRASMEQKTFNPISSTLQIEIKRLYALHFSLHVFESFSDRIETLEKENRCVQCVYETFFERALSNYFFSLPCTDFLN